jgi:hypothetical protein
MEPLKQRITSRKFIGSVTVFLTSVALLVTGHINPGTWSTVTLAVFATYSAANVGEKHVQTKSK